MLRKRFAAKSAPCWAPDATSSVSSAPGLPARSLKESLPMQPESVDSAQSAAQAARLARIAARIRVAHGDAPADVVLTGGQVVNVLSGEVYPADVAILAGEIAAVGPPGAYQ